MSRLYRPTLVSSCAINVGWFWLWSVEFGSPVVFSTMHLAVCEAMAAVADRCRLVALGSSTTYGKGNETLDPRGVMAPSTFRGAVKGAESLAVSAMARLHQFPCTELRPYEWTRRPSAERPPILAGSGN